MTPAELASSVLGALRAAVEAGELSVAVPENVAVERARGRGRGDYATNVALRLAKAAGTTPRAVAGAVAGHLREVRGIAGVDVAGPGFLNITLDAAGQGELARVIVEAGDAYGRTPGTAGGDEVPPRLRGGNAAAFDDIVERIGVDAARYALARTSADSAPVLDIDLLIRQNDDNPVFRVRYAHARMCAVQRYAAQMGLRRGGAEDFRPELLTHECEAKLLGALGEYPRVVATAVELGEPQRVTRYLEQLAEISRRFCDGCPILPRGDEEFTATNRARLWLAEAAQTVLRGGLGLLDVSAPERM